MAIKENMLLEYGKRETRNKYVGISMHLILISTF